MTTLRFSLGASSFDATITPTIAVGNTDFSAVVGAFLAHYLSDSLDAATLLLSGGTLYTAITGLWTLLQSGGTLYTQIANIWDAVSDGDTTLFAKLKDIWDEFDTGGRFSVLYNSLSSGGTLWNIIDTIYDAIQAGGTLFDNIASILATLSTEGFFGLIGDIVEGIDITVV